MSLESVTDLATAARPQICAIGNQSMDESARRRIREIKSNIEAMLVERQTLRDPGAPPSSYWTDFCSAFDYMLGLPESAFLKLRIHTYHFTAETYQTYYFGNADRFWAANHVTELTRGIPPGLVINEPAGGIGFHYPCGRFLSEDTIRFQKVINTLYRSGIIGPLRERKASTVLEIGAGYGGLAHHISQVLPGVHYLIVDLPESLLFSAAYLTLQNPGKRIYLYEPTDDTEVTLSRIRNGAFDFALFPNYKIGVLRPLSFDLVLNTASLQEMKADQVERYLDFIRDTCAGVFYSRNQDRQPRNRELVSLNSMMRSRFQMTEIPEWRARVGAGSAVKRYVRSAARSLAVTLGLMPSASKEEDNPYRQFISTPLRS